MVSKKSQSAMEYLMTYGWAILVVLIALGALFYLGVFNPQTSNSCISGDPITCIDIKVSGTTVTLVLGATGTSSATVSAVSLNTPTAMTCGTITGSIGTITPATVTCTATSAVNRGTKFVGNASITYTLQGSTTSHNKQVTFSGTAE